MTPSENHLDKRAMLFVVSDKTPWVHEPDYWSSSYEGNLKIHLIAARDKHGGFWRGFVGVPQIWVGTKIRLVRDELIVHGGVTSQGLQENLGGRPLYWYYGFDCDHIGAAVDGLSDFSPRHYRENIKYRMDNAVYRDLTYVQNQCRQLAAQLDQQRNWWVRVKSFFARVFFIAKPR